MIIWLGKALMFAICLRHIKLCRQESYDLILQEAACCNQALMRGWHSSVDEEATVHVITKLMLHGKVKAAVK